MQIVAEICQNRTTGKDRFFRKYSVAQIEKCKTNKIEIITWGMRTKNCRSKYYSEICHDCLQRIAEICFWIATSVKSYLLSIRGYSWHKNKIKRIRRGCYRGKNFQDSRKQK
jgi:hypothetical protein